MNALLCPTGTVLGCYPGNSTILCRQSKLPISNHEFYSSLTAISSQNRLPIFPPQISSSMASRNEVVGIIESLLKIAEDPENQEFSAAYLKQLGITFSTFSLLDNDSPTCTPWPRESFEEAFGQLPDYQIPRRPSYNEDRLVPKFDRVFPIHKALVCQDYLVDYFVGLGEHRRWNAY